MSKHDTQFFNHFSMVIGILVTIAILLIALSKVVGADNQLQHLKTEALQLAAVDERTRPSMSARGRSRVQPSRVRTIALDRGLSG